MDEHIAPVTVATRRKLHTMYFHRSKDSNYEMALDDNLNLSDAAMEKFIYAGYKIALNCEVDLDTGEVFAYAVGSVKLEKPVRI